MENKSARDCFRKAPMICSSILPGSFFYSDSRAEYCVERSVSVCLSARISHEPHVGTSPNLLFVLPMAVARSSSSSVSVFYALPVLLMTSCCPIMGPTAA